MVRTSKTDLRLGTSVWLLVAIAVPLLVACRKPEADKRLFYGSSKEIETFLRDHRAKVTMAECDNIKQNANITRGFSCLTKFDEESFRVLTAKAELAKDLPDRGSGKEGRCEWRPGFESRNEGIEIWRASWSCEKRGGPFSYLEIRLAPSTGEACVEVLPLACN